MPKVIHQSTHIKNLNSKVKIFSPSVKSRFMFFMSAVMFSAMNLMIFASPTHATDVTDTQDSDFSVVVEKSLNVTLSSNAVVLNINPTYEGAFNSTSMTVTASTNNTTGYNLTMMADTNVLTRRGSSETISPIPANTTYTEDTFENGYWGYKIGTTSTNYALMPTSPVAIHTTDEHSNSNVTTIVFGSKLNLETVAGLYEGPVITFVATTNVVPLVIDDVEYLQDLYGISSADKTTLLASMTENQAYSLKDNRDGQSYHIAKLADGNIWFLDNLRLDLTDSTVKTKLTSATTNATDTSLNCLTGRTTGCTSPYTTAAVVTPVNWTLTEAEIATDYSTTINSDSSLNYGNGSHMYGVYYNYCAASAGSYCMSSSTATDGDGSGNANQDICPAGWRMPTGNSTGEWGALRSTINNNTASDSASIQARLSLPLSGRFYGGFAYYQGSYGYWWSSTRSDGYGMYYFYAGATYANAAYISDRVYGNSVRCLFSAS